MNEPMKCPEPGCEETFADGGDLWRHHKAHIDADWQAVKSELRFEIPDEETRS